MPRAPTAIILGASVIRGKPSQIVAERIAAAAELYRAGIVRTIIVSGDTSERHYDEVETIARELLERGIPASDVFLDRAGFDTYSSMYHVRSIFNTHTAIIVTQDFHLPRALFIARALGIDAYGFTARGGSTWDYIREIPASAKAIGDIITHRNPE